MIKATMTFLLISMTGLCPAFAEICVKDFAEFKAKRAEMPPVFRQDPLKFAISKFGGAGGVTIIEDSGKIKIIQGKKVAFSNLDITEEYVRQVCIQGNEMRVTLESGTPPIVVNVKAVNATTIEVGGYNLAKDSKLFDEIVREKYGKAGTSNAGTSAKQSGGVK